MLSSMKARFTHIKTTTIYGNNETEGKPAAVISTPQDASCPEFVPDAPMRFRSSRSRSMPRRVLNSPSLEPKKNETFKGSHDTCTRGLECEPSCQKVEENASHHTFCADICSDKAQRQVVLSTRGGVKAQVSQHTQQGFFDLSVRTDTNNMQESVVPRSRIRVRCDRATGRSHVSIDDGEHVNMDLDRNNIRLTSAARPPNEGKTNNTSEESPREISSLENENYCNTNARRRISFKSDENNSIEKTQQEIVERRQDEEEEDLMTAENHARFVENAPTRFPIHVDVTTSPQQQDFTTPHPQRRKNNVKKKQKRENMELRRDLAELDDAIATTRQRILKRMRARRDQFQHGECPSISATLHRRRSQSQTNFSRFSPPFNYEGVFRDLD